MGFQLSPGVNVSEVDLTGFIPAVATTGGAFVGQFDWGPVEEYKTIEDKNKLEKWFGKPSDVNYRDWFSCANFLAYSANLNVVRVVESTALNASADGSGILIKNETLHSTILGTPSGDAAMLAARFPGALGNSLKVSMADATTFDSWDTNYKDLFDSAPSTSGFAENLGGSNDELHVVVVDEDGLFSGVPGTVLERFAYVSKAKDAKRLDGEPSFYGSILNKQSEYIWFLEVPAASAYVVDGSVNELTITDAGTGYVVGDAITVTGDGNGFTAEVATIDTGGEILTITITNAGTGYTTATVDFSAGSGTGATADAVITDTSTDAAWNTAAAGATFSNLATAYTVSLSAGTNGSAVTANELIVGWDMFTNSEVVDVSLLFVGDAGGDTEHTAVVKHVIDNVVEARKDAMAFFSPLYSDVVGISESTAVDNAIATRDTVNTVSSYAVMDSGYKYQYDAYNDKYRWIPLNADIAGLAAYTDNVSDPWYSPAGFTRGQIKNVIQLALNPSKISRDKLYKSSINPVVSFTGEGVLLYGDRTQQAKPSAFQKINIRRLFIVLEKAVAVAAKYQLFEFNDSFTRAQFVNMVEPFLREVKGRRGIFDYSVVCDETNNTSEVVDRSEFVADIYVKPAYSINFIQLNFVAVRSGVEFSEIIG